MNMEVERILDQFQDYFCIVTDPEFTDFERSIIAKKRCIARWKAYRSMSKSSEIAESMNIMRNVLGDRYEECMDSRESLEKRLNICINHRRSENTRKNELSQRIVAYIADKRIMLKSRVLKVNFNGFSKEEINKCYEELVECDRLEESKFGKRYYVWVSEMERGKRIGESGI